MVEEDFCLITVFRFGKVNLDPDEVDHSEFRMCVFSKIENLKGEHLLELVNKDVEFAKLDDEDDIWGLKTFSNSIHWWRKDENVIPREVRHEVHVRTEVSRMIIDLQFRLNSVEEKLKPGPSDVDHLDKTGNLSKKAFDCGLDQQSMGGVSQCMNSVEGVSQCTGLNDEYETIAVDGLISLRSQDVGHLSKKYFVVDSPQFKVKDNEKAYHYDFCLSTQQVQDTCVFELLDVVKDDVNVNSVVKKEIVKDDVNVNSLLKEDIEKDDVHVDNGVQFDSVVKDVEQIENETLPRLKFSGKAYLSSYIQPPSTEVKCRKRRREIKLEKVEKSYKTVVGSDGVEVKLLPWKEYPLYYAYGVKYGVPWFANNVKKVYFPIIEKDSHWVFEELHISFGLITIYDSLGRPNGIETRLFWLDLREKLQFHIPLFLDNAEMFKKKNTVKDGYSISFQFADGVPIQGGLYGDCGLWVCIFFTGCHIIYLWRLMIPSVLHPHIVND
uniref:Ulp1 protease family, C-terminal catalytic domain-containing protein n=1 Tax=Tanacetum cinerariifolium TaxID=118510 RepID=A0A699H4V3_TANCI|nr:ulp1 protease family, C-terminal catalytic domain-containing protein [Tanacetum cinerariifolium]